MISHNYTRLVFSMFLIFGVISCQSKNLLGTVEALVFENECFELQNNSFLYTLNYCSNKEECYGIQSYAIQKHFSNNMERNLPNSQIELVSDLNYWNHKINQSAKVSGFVDTRYAGTVKKSTTLKVTRVEYNNRPSFGSFWSIEAILTSGQHKGKTIQFSDLLYLLQPSWLVHSKFETGPVWDDRFVKTCSTPL